MCKQSKKNIIKLRLLHKTFFIFFFYRRSTILKPFLNYTAKIYDGKKKKKNKITCLHYLKKASVVSFTKKPFFFPIKKKKK